MLLLLIVVFYITIIGANYPSDLLFSMFNSFEGPLISFFNFLHFPTFLTDALVLGAYKTLGWVVSVMLPPMAIFFPMFTILEDSGYLPRIAFNLDRCFKKCNACGKQALTMCMGFGCNAVGVSGCRIIDSKRERLIAILTNNFVPCNGRFPAIISIITMFFVGFSTGASLLKVFFLTAVILLGIFTTLFVSNILSRTLLKGEPSSFTLELPPYRKPQYLKVIIRSIMDRTLRVLLRAIVVALPTGLVIYLFANVNIEGTSILLHLSNFLDPFATIIGLDGVILLAFILGFPANEIVVPIIIMSYLSTGVMTDFTSLVDLKQLLVDNGWTTLTAICTILFSLMHWPCSTTCLTIKKETGSLKWTLLSILIPTICGITLCFITATIFRLFII
ncbi:MAG: ferrous iron transporter B, partial [Bacilli bacterium]|nr:ferrous iron transporter B [Bacilli bacterium]